MTWGEYLRRMRTLPGAWVFVLGTVVGFALISLPGRGPRGDLDFYSTAAQIIPVFLLAAMVEVGARTGQLRELRDDLRRLNSQQDSLVRDAAELDSNDLRHAVLRRQVASYRDELVGAEKRLNEQFLHLTMVATSYLIAAVPGLTSALISLALGEGSVSSLGVVAVSLGGLLIIYLRGLAESILA